jgi:hypothetical protein
MQKKTISGYRLSPQQKRLWLLDQGSSSTSYRARCAILLQGNLKADLLREALHDVVKRHEILRTTFDFLPGMDLPLQVIKDSCPPSFELYELRGQNADHQQSAIKGLYESLSSSSFDYQQGPLLNLKLAVMSDDKHMMLICSPSLCSDALSLTNLVRELIQSYEALLNGERLSHDPVQYVDI